MINDVFLKREDFSRSSLILAGKSFQISTTLFVKYSVLSRTEKGHGIFFFKKGTLHVEI